MERAEREGEHKYFLPKNKIRSPSQYLKLCFVWHNATSLSFLATSEKELYYVFNINGYAKIKYEAFNIVQQYFLSFPIDQAVIRQLFLYNYYGFAMSFDFKIY